MTKQKIIDPELKQAINFSNLNSLEKGLGIAIMRNWSEVSIKDVPEDKIESVKKWVKKKQSQHRDITIHIGRTYIRDWVINFSSIYALEKGLNRAVKENLREIIIDDVPEDKIKVIQNWIKKNKGKFEGIKVSIKKTLRDLTLEDEEIFEMKYRAELDYNRVQLCENEIKKFQKYNEPECPVEWKPLRLGEKLEWWEQKLKKSKAQYKINADRRQRENEAAQENEKTAKKLEDALPILEKHSHIGNSPRRHNSLLNNFIDNFDKEFSKNRKEVPPAKALALEMKKAITKNIGKHSFVIEVEDENDCIKWRNHKGNIQSSAWGDPMRCRITRVRKGRKNK